MIQRAVWMYLRFTLSYRDVEDLLAERSVEVSYEAIRRWLTTFEPVMHVGCGRGAQFVGAGRPVSEPLTESWISPIRNAPLSTRNGVPRAGSPFSPGGAAIPFGADRVRDDSDSRGDQHQAHHIERIREGQDQRLLRHRACRAGISP